MEFEQLEFFFADAKLSNKKIANSPKTWLPFSVSFLSKLTSNLIDFDTSFCGNGNSSLIPFGAAIVTASSASKVTTAEIGAILMLIVEKEVSDSQTTADKV